MTEWKGVLLDAAARAQRVADEAAAGTARGRVVGRGAAGDMTIEADRDAESAILECLSGAEGLRVVSEERGEIGSRESRWTAIVDPIDGSSNFERGIPFYCTSIAIVEGRRLSDARFAVVRNLVNGEVYYAESGKGATKNGGPIATSKAGELEDAVLTIDVSKSKADTVVKLAPLISSVKRQVHFGANALELCYMAEGRVDGVVDIRNRMRVTDYAGAFLIAREAGAVQTTQDGQALDPPLDISSRFGFVASANPTIHQKILQKLK